MDKTTHPNEIYAVIVGIDRYRDFDPSGACDLLGAANDANAWVSLLQDRFYVPADHIRLLSTGSHPAASPVPEAPLPQRSQPTRLGIEEALSWLAKMLSREGASGLIAYSGHGIELPGYEGDQQGMNLAICPTDITPSLEGALTLSDLQERLLHVLKSLGGCDPSSVLQNLTIVIDACYRSGDRLASSRTLGGSRKLFQSKPLSGIHPPIFE